MIEVIKLNLKSMTRYIRPLSVLLLGSVLSFIAFQAESKLEKDKVRLDFIEEAKNRCSALEREVNLNLQMLASLQAFYYHAEIARNEHRGFVHHLLLHPQTIRALAWVPLVTDAEREAYERRGRKDGFPNFQFTQQLPRGEMARASRRAQYFPAYFVEPYQENELAVGFDLAFDPACRESLMLSRDTGALVATAPVELVPGKGHQKSFLVFAPVYHETATHDTPLKRRDSLKGFALGVFQPGDILEKSLDYLQPAGIDISIYDKSEPDRETLLYFHATRMVPKTSASAPAQKIVEQAECEYARSLDVAGRHWVVLCKANHFYSSASGTKHSLILLLVGLAITGLISGYLYSNQRRIDRIKLLVRERTKELEETNEALSREVVVRVQTEDILQATNEILDVRVREQTADLLAANGQLRQEIDERLQAEERAKEAKELLERTFASLNEVILVIDPISRVVIKCNQAIKSVFGYEAQEVIGRNTLFLHVDQETYERLGNEQASAQTTRGTFNTEYFMRRKEGDIFPVEIISSQICDNTGRRTLNVAAVRDISERRRAEAELLIANRSLKTLSYCNQALVYASEERSLLIEICQNIVNNSGYRFAWVGYAMDDGTKRVRPVVHAGADEGYLDSKRWTLDESDTGRGPVGVSIRTGAPCIVKDAASDPDCAPWADEIRKRGFVSIAAFPLIAGGKTFGMLAIYSGTTEAFDAGEVQLLQELVSNLAYGISSLRIREAHRHAEETLRESEELYRSLVENIEVGIHLVDENFRTVMANRAMGRICGKDPAELLGKECFRELKGRYSVCPECPGIMAMGSGKVAAREKEISSQTGSRRVVRIQAFPVRDRYGRTSRFIELIEDITDEKNVETDKRHLESQLRQSQKMEAIGTLAGGIAHDFNNILTAIVGYATLMQLQMEEDNPWQRKLSQILSASNRAAALTQSLLAYSRKQVSNPVSVGLNSIITKSELLLQRLIPENIEMKTLLIEEDLTVMVDSGQIEQVLMNLAVNARDAMCDGGELLIATEQIMMDQNFIAAHGYGTAGSYALLTVSDSGVGMDENTRNRIFEPFFTTKEVGRGTGLGLAMAYGIVKQHGGFINCYSEPGNGTVFRIYLPLVTVPVQKVIEPIDQDVAGGDETILLVEDDRALREMVGELLEDFGYTVIKAVDGEDAIDKFKEFRDAVQMVILDVIMPKMNGKEAYNVISELSPGIKVLFMSGYTADILTGKLVDDDAYYFVSKPIKINKFLGKVREVLDA